MKKKHMIKFINNNYLFIILVIINSFIVGFLLNNCIIIPRSLKILIAICLIGFLISLSFIKKEITYFYTIINVILLCSIIGIKIYHQTYNNDTNYGFKKYSNKPVFGEEKTGSFFDPHVIMINDEYIMYFSYRNKGSIALSKSKDGVNWSEPIIVLDNNSSSNWEGIVNRASVIYKDNKYMMWYTGQITDYSAIGYAESDDGIHFKRLFSNPVLKPDLSYEQKSVMNPHVIYDNDEKLFKMWYAAGEQYEPDIICYATSIDGITWKKYSSNPVLTKSQNNIAYDSYKVGAVDVHKLDKNKYLMFYIGYTDINTARIMYALSSDGITWKKSDNYVISGTKYNFDQEAVYKPSAIYNKLENKWYLWYNGRTSNKEFIGLAYNKKYNFFE